MDCFCEPAIALSPSFCACSVLDLTCQQAEFNHYVRPFPSLSEWQREGKRGDLLRFMKEQDLHCKQSQSLGLLGVVPGCNGHSSRHSTRQRGSIGWGGRSGSATAEEVRLGCGRLRLLGRGFDGICYGDWSRHRSLFYRLVGNSSGISKDFFSHSS